MGFAAWQLSGRKHKNAQRRRKEVKAGFIDACKTAAGILDAKKADQINVIRISDVSSLGDYFVLANGTGSTHVHALADELEFKLKELGIAPDRVEGYRSDSWVVLDYETVVVHIFTSEARSFYDLDRLWLDGEKLNMTFEPN